MRRLLLLSTLSGLLVTPCLAQDDPPGLQPEPPEYRVFGKPSSAEAGEALAVASRGFSDAWASGDAAAIASYYADDAEWTNAFGDVVRGPADLQAFLTWMFAQDDKATSAGEITEARRVSLRYLGDDVAVAHAQTRSTRGEARSGEGTRQNHLTFVWAKMEGEWKIVHQMIMDAR